MSHRNSYHWLERTQIGSFLLANQNLLCEKLSKQFRGFFIQKTHPGESGWNLPPGSPGWINWIFTDGPEPPETPTDSVNSPGWIRMKSSSGFTRVNSLNIHGCSGASVQKRLTLHWKYWAILEIKMKQFSVKKSEKSAMTDNSRLSDNKSLDTFGRFRLCIPTGNFWINLKSQIQTDHGSSIIHKLIYLHSNPADWTSTVLN